MSLLERIYFFHQKLQDQRFPNATTLVDQFEVSLATARRDIAYLRDRLLAPIDFDGKRNGFYYNQEEFSLPFERSPKIIFLLGMLNKMAEEAGLAELPEIKAVEEKLSSFIFPEYGRLVDNIHCEWVEIESLQPLIFETIIESIVTRHLLKIEYHTTKGRATERTLEPERLINYQGRWYLLAHCRLRDDMRIFHIARIKRATLSKSTFEPSAIDHELLQRSFGIFKGKTTYWAEILFTSTAAELVRHQHWHAKQTMEETSEGLLLRLPVSDNREILTKVMQYGSMAKVIQPEDLQEQVKEEIQRMTSLYSL